jgi:hypothetical protein
MRSLRTAALLTLLLAVSGSISCSDSGDDSGSGAGGMNAVTGGVGGATGGAGGAAGMMTGGAGGMPVGGAAGTMSGAGGMTGGTGGMTGGTGGMTGGTGGNVMTGGMGGTGGSGGDTMTGGTGGSEPELPECELDEPAEFENNTVGGGSGSATDSAHFRIHGASGAQAQAALDLLEGAYSCFVETLCWRSSGLSINDDADDGPYARMNVYAVGGLGSAAGVMSSEAGPGHAFLRVVTSYLDDPNVTVHEYGHALTYYEKGWIEQTRTGAWWETVANFVADTYLTSPLCAPAREAHGQTEGDTIIDLNKVIGSAHQVIVDGTPGSGNYYQAWPFLTYLTNNPDGYEGLGTTCLRDMFRQHMGNNETPLHVLDRIAEPSAGQVVASYWAHMAYVDIGHEKAQEAFFARRTSINYANLDSTGSGMYRVKSARQPRYMGANIIPLTGTGTISAEVESDKQLIATLAVLEAGGSVRYTTLVDGAGEVTVASGEEASLVVVNVPATLLTYDPFSISGEAAAGLNYTVQLTGATPAD